MALVAIVSRDTVQVLGQKVSEHLTQQRDRHNATRAWRSNYRMRNTGLSLQRISDAILASCTIVRWTIEMDEIYMGSLCICIGDNQDTAIVL
jgi:hypothetical protein